MIHAELGDRGRSAAPLKMSGDRRSLHVESVTYRPSTAQDERAAVLYEGGTRTAVSQNDSPLMWMQIPDARASLASLGC